MRTTRSFVSRVALCATIVGGTAMLSAAASSDRSVAFKGGPWISIETPVNPYDQSARGALFLVHTFHHAALTDLTVEGRAEGLVDGQRRTVPLSLRKSAQVGTYAVNKEWGSSGTWSVIVTATQPAPHVSIQALVDIGADGEVARVSLPRRMLTTADIDRSLRERARTQLTLGGR